MKKLSKSLNQSIDWFVQGLKKEQPELAAAVQKWKPFIFRSAINVARVSHISEEDALSEIMVAVADVCELYRAPLYRHGGHLYRVKQEDGKAVLLETPRTRQSAHEVWTDKAQIEPVKTAKIDSTLYQRVEQKCVNLMKAVFTAKRGYDEDSGRLPHMVDIDYPEQSREWVDPSLFPTLQEVGDHLMDLSGSPEGDFASTQIKVGLCDGISDLAFDVFQDLVDEPCLSDVSLSQRLGVSQRSVRTARREISRTFAILHHQHEQQQGCHPIYIRADEVC